MVSRYHWKDWHFKSFLNFFLLVYFNMTTTLLWFNCFCSIFGVQYHYLDKSPFSAFRAPGLIEK